MDFCRIDSDSSDRVRSLGSGIELEVLTLLFQEYVRNPVQWLTQSLDGHCRLTTTHNASTARFISTSRRQSMAVFGAIVALCLIRGMSVFPLDPLVLILFTNNCDLRCITQSILVEWHPEFKHTVDTFIAAGSNGDLTPFQSHFASFHDVQVHHLIHTPYILLALTLHFIRLHR